MTSIFSYSFIYYVISGIILTAIITGIIGAFVVVRRMVFIAGGVTHSSFAGIGLGIFLGQSPLLYAFLASILSGLGVELATKNNHIREDSAIAAIWSLGMAIGVILIFLTPGYNSGLTAYLFGNILLIKNIDLILISSFLLINIPLLIIYYPILLYTSFDSEYGYTRGLPVGLIKLIMMIMICIGIVLSIRVVGIMMLMSMLTIPQITVSQFTDDFKKIIIYSVILSIISGIIAFFGSYIFNLPTGAFSIIVLTVIFFFSKLYILLKGANN